MDKLNSNFLDELFKTCLKSNDVLQTTITYLKYEYLPAQEYKKILKIIYNTYELDKEKLTIGVLSQKLDNDEDALEVLTRIKKSDANTNQTLFTQLEDYIRRAWFIDLYNRMGEFYNEGKRDKAINLLEEEGSKINEFTIKEKEFEPIFGGFEKRYKERKRDADTGKNLLGKVSFGIDSLDERTNGGCDIGDIFECVMPSGMGKTKYLRYLGVHNARLGKRVLHIQAEGTKKEVQDGYDATIAGVSMTNMEFAQLDETRLKKVKKSINNVNGEIYIYAFEQFGQANMLELEQIVNDAIKSYGNFDLVILDYIDKFEPSNNKKYAATQEGEKMRRQAIADDFKNICVKHEMAGGTATQTSDIPSAKKNDPNFVITRSYIKGDKNQVEPFSYVFTGNQTNDEYNNGIMRIFEEKLRKYKAGAIHHIVTAYNNERFYSPQKTRQMFLNESGHLANVTFKKDKKEN